MAGAVTVTVRFSAARGARVERRRFAVLDEALAALEEQLSGLASQARRDTIDLSVRRFEPVAQIAARAEIAGPRRLRGGVDLRGDGSMEAFTGRLRRQVVEQRAGESPFHALQRALGQSVSVEP
ncbi:MAG: hypothetical protein ACR2ML_01840 [Solirubrobacteraceae bacterium]